MRADTLPSPGNIRGGVQLRVNMANAISGLEVVAPAYGGRHPEATNLAAFLTACLTAVNALKPGTTAPTVTFTPTAKTYSIAAGSTAGPTMAKGGSTGAATYSSSNPSIAEVNATTGAVTGKAVGTATIRVDIAADGTYAAASQTYVATVTA